MFTKTVSPFYIDVPVKHERFRTEFFDSGNAPLQLNRYVDGSLVISVFDMQGGVSGHEHLSFNPSDYYFKAQKNHVFVKDYGMHVGVGDALVELGLARKVNELEVYGRRGYILEFTFNAEEIV